MDELSCMFVDMVAGPSSQLRDAPRVAEFVERVRGLIERSASPQRNFLVDAATPHGDAVITESAVLKPSIGWITLHTTEGIARGTHEWCVRIEDHGETNDGSGLMLGLVPKSFNKYDSFISQGGGWCISRAGKFYGHWRRRDSAAHSLTFETGDRVIFTLDYEAARLTVRVGERSVVGEMSNLAGEVFPAVSLHYRHQHVRFEYHAVHDRRTRCLGWQQRQLVPCAAALLPASHAQLRTLALDSHVFAPLAAAPRQSDDTVRAATHRFTVLANALAAVRHHAALLGRRETFCDVSAEYLRRLDQQAALAATPAPGGSATADVGGLVLLGLFESVVRGAGQGAADLPLALVARVAQYLLTLPPAAMAEDRRADSGGAAAAALVSPLVSTHTVETLDSLLQPLVAGAGTGSSGTGTAAPPASPSALQERMMELLLVVALQGARVGQLLRVARMLLRLPTCRLTPDVAAWLRRHHAVMQPALALPDLATALVSVCTGADSSSKGGGGGGTTDNGGSLRATRLDPSQTILSACYTAEGTVVVHTSSGLFMHSGGAATSANGGSGNGGSGGATAGGSPAARDSPEAPRAATGAPDKYCCGAAHSSLVCLGGRVLLHTDLMARDHVLFCEFDAALVFVRVHAAGDADLRALTEPPVTAAKWCAFDGTLVGVLRCVTSPAGARPPAPLLKQQKPHPGVDAAAAVSVECVVLSSSPSATGTPQVARRVPLLWDEPGSLTFERCARLARPGHFSLGDPAEALRVAGGHVAVEVWVTFLDRESGGTFYQHGDKAAGGEVFLELARVDGVCCVRGGYRHDSRGTCVIAAAVPPSADRTFLHVALQFNGAWRLYFDGAQVAANQHGPFVALEAPKQRWTLGGQCTCLVAGLRVWRCSRDPRQLQRDARRPLTGTDAGLVCQLFLNEEGGNVARNYRAHPGAKMAVAVGPVEFVRTAAAGLPLRHPLAGCAVACCADASQCECAANGVRVYRPPLGQLWARAAEDAPHVARHHDDFLTLVRRVTAAESPFALQGGRVFSFFDIGSGASPNGLFFLTDKSPARGLLGSDEHGGVWELFDTDASGGAPPPLTPATPPPPATRSKVISLAKLPELISFTARAALGGGVATAAAAAQRTEGIADPWLREPFGDDQTAAAPPSFPQVGEWLLRLLSAHAAAGRRDATPRLYSPFSDDVGVALVRELKGVFAEHLRVVRGSNARRSVVYRDGATSQLVVATALRLLHRLIRSVRAFRLPPYALGLALAADSVPGAAATPPPSVSSGGVSSGGISGVIRSFRQRHRGSLVGGGEPSAHSAAATAAPAGDGSALLSALEDVIDESTESMAYGMRDLATGVLAQGVGLFVPLPCDRAEMLSEILLPGRADDSELKPSPPPPKGPGAAPVARRTNSGSGAPTGSAAVRHARSAAHQSLIESLQRSLSSVDVVATILVPAEQLTADAVSASSSEATTVSRVRVLGSTCACLLQESLGQLRRPATAQASAASVAVLRQCYSATQLVLLAALQCDRAESQGMYKHYEDNVLYHVAAADEAAAPGCSTGSSGAAAGTIAAIAKDHYTAVFAYLREAAELLGASSAAADGKAAATDAFLMAPLYTALVAIPLVLRMPDAPWFLEQLKAVTTTLQTSIPEDAPPAAAAAAVGVTGDATPPDAVGDSLRALHSIATFTFIWVSTAMSSSSSDAGGARRKSQAPPLRELLAHPLLRGGLLPTPTAAAVSSASPRYRLIVDQMVLGPNASRWSSVIKKDPLGARMSEEEVRLVALAAAAALYLSNARVRAERPAAAASSSSSRGNAKAVSKKPGPDSTGKRTGTAAAAPVPDAQTLVLFESVLALMKPFRSAMVSGGTRQEGRSRAESAQEIRDRLSLLLRFRSCTETNALTDPLYGGGGGAEEPNTATREAGGSPWRRLRRAVCRRVRLHRLEVAGDARLELRSAVALVSQFALSTAAGVSAQALQALCDAAERQCAVRALGLRCLRSAATTMPGHLAGVAEMMRLSSSVAAAAGETSEGGKTDASVAEETDAAEDAVDACDENGASSASLDDLRALFPGPFLRRLMDAGEDGALLVFVQQRWRPRELRVMADLGIARRIFAAHCTIFVAGAAGQPQQQLVPEEEKAAEHAQAAATHAAELLRAEAEGKPHGGGGCPKDGLEGEAGDKAMVLTAPEATLRSALGALRSLGLQCARLLHSPRAPAEVLAVHAFLAQLLGALADEVAAGVAHLKTLSREAPHADDAAAAARTRADARVQQQMLCVASLASCVAAALPPGRALATECVVAPLVRLAAALLSACAEMSLGNRQQQGEGEEAVKGGEGDSAVSALYSVACQLLAHCPPAAARAPLFAALPPSTPEHGDDAASDWHSWGPEHGAMAALMCLCLRRLSATGLTDAAQRMLGALRRLLGGSPAWQRLALVPLQGRFTQDVQALANRMLGGAAAPTSLEALQRCCLKVLVWSAALGAQSSLHAVAPGERVVFKSSLPPSALKSGGGAGGAAAAAAAAAGEATSTEYAGYVLHVSAEHSRVLVARTATAATGDSSYEAIRSDYVWLSLGEVVLAPLRADEEGEPGENYCTPTPVPAHRLVYGERAPGSRADKLARAQQEVVTAFGGSAVAVLSARLCGAADTTASPHVSAAASSSLELAACASVLDTLRHCVGLASGKGLLRLFGPHALVLHRLAAALRASYPLPLPYLREFAAAAVHGNAMSLKQLSTALPAHATSAAAAAGTTAAAAAAVPLPPAAAPGVATSSFSAPPAPPLSGSAGVVASLLSGAGAPTTTTAATTATPNGSAANATVGAVRRPMGGLGGLAGSTLSPLQQQQQQFLMGMPGGGVLLDAATGAQFLAAQHGGISRGAAVPTADAAAHAAPSLLAFYADTEGTVGGGGGCGCVEMHGEFPKWFDGMCIETAFLLCDHTFPDLGEDFTTCASLAHPNFSFPLLNMSTGSNGAAPAPEPPLLQLQVAVTGFDVVCSFTFADFATEMHLPLSAADWDGFLHLAVLLERGAVTLVKGLDVAASALPPLIGEAMERCLGASDAAAAPLSLSLGQRGPGAPTAAAAAAQPPPPDGDVLVLVSGLRVWGTAMIKASIQYLSEMMSRDQCLPPFDSSSDCRFFPLREGTGGVIVSTDGRCAGELCGAVRWVSCPFKAARCPLRPERNERLYSGVVPTFAADGFAVPREEMAKFFGSGGPASDAVRSGVLETLLAALARRHWKYLTRRLLAQLAVSPESGRPPAHALVPHRDTLRSVTGMFRYTDGAALEDEDLELLHDLTRFMLDSADTPAALASLFAQAARAVLALPEDAVDRYPLALPAPRPATKDVVLPLCSFHGGVCALQLDNRTRSIEHAVVYKDAPQKTAVCKFPDPQGGWPECVLHESVGWHYLSLRGSAGAANSGGRLALELRTRSYAPALLRAVLTAAVQWACERRPALGDAEVLAPLLSARVLGALVHQIGLSCSPAAPATFPSATAHEVGIMAAVMELWRHFPALNRFDQSPLHVLLAHINLPLVSLFQRGPASAPVMLSPLGSFNAHTQALIGLVFDAVQLGCAWRGEPYRLRVRRRWLKFGVAWSQCTLRRLSDGASLAPVEPGELQGLSVVQLAPHPPGADASAVAVHQKQCGIWRLRRTSAGADPATTPETSTFMSTVGFARGRFYFEVRVLDCHSGGGGAGSLQVGVATARCRGGEALGQDAESWIFDGGRLCRAHNGLRGEFPVRVRWRPGDIIGVLADVEGNRVTCFHNDRQASCFEVLRPSHSSSNPTAAAQCYFPVVNVLGGACEVNLGTAPFLASLPVGFMPVHPHYYTTAENAQFWFMDLAYQWGRCLAAREDSNTGCESLHPAGPDEDTQQAMVRMLAAVCEETSAYCAGRAGPLAVDILATGPGPRLAPHTQDVQTDAAPAVVYGTVAVSSGRWYYEIAVSEDSNFSVGWTSVGAAAAQEHTFVGKVPSLGDNAHTWVLEGRRMVAKHDRRQINIALHRWRDGDVVGCLVDCDAGRISFFINGVEQRELHAAPGEAAEGSLFGVIAVPDGGLVPVVGLESKTSAMFLWNEVEITYLPPGSKPLSATLCVHQAIVSAFLGISTAGTAEAPSAPALTLPTAARQMRALVRRATESTAVDPWAVSSALLPAASASSSNADSDAQRTATLCHVASFVVQCLFPYALPASLPPDVASDRLLHSGCLARCYERLLPHVLPYAGLTVLRRYLCASEPAPPEALKLTVNRRKALAVLGDAAAGPRARLADGLFGQIYSLLGNKPATLYRSRRKLWSVSFLGEGADDVGGPYREALTQLCAEVMSPATGLFVPVPNHASGVGEGQDALAPRPRPPPPVELGMYRFLGRLLGGCLRGGEPLPLYLPSAVWRALAGSTSPQPGAAREDLQRLDAAAAQSLDYLRQRAAELRSTGETAALDAELQDLCPGNFTLPAGGEDGAAVELVDGGAALPVTGANVEVYAALAARCRLEWLGRPQRRALCDGFHEVVSACAVRGLQWFQLEELACGSRDYDPDAVLDAAELQGLAAADAPVRQLRQTLRDFTRRERAAFMRFVTGRERLPPGTRLRLIRDGGGGGGDTGAGLPTPPPPPQAASSADDPTARSRPDGADTASAGAGSDAAADDARLPHSSTCFFWLYLPPYSSQAVMAERLRFAMEQCLDIDADFRIHDDGGDARQDQGPALARIGPNDDEPLEDFSQLR